MKTLATQIYPSFTKVPLTIKRAITDYLYKNDMFLIHLDEDMALLLPHGSPKNNNDEERNVHK
ncbi:MAG: hypothetical protein ACTHJ4_04370 [Candidatus Nucleicultricaceae bacterium]